MEKCRISNIVNDDDGDDDAEEKEVIARGGWELEAICLLEMGFK